jgi:two-component system phosphate regulon sensor histidine kinase PhoR
VARKRLLFQLYPFQIAILVISLLAATMYASHVAERLYMRSTEESLLARARLVEREFGKDARYLNESAADSLCGKLGRAAGARVTGVLASGAVVADTDEDPLRMENHGDRPEIIRALAGGVGSSIRYSDTKKMNMMYVAVPWRMNGEIVGAVRASVPLSLVEKSLHGMHVRIFIGGVVVTLLAALVALALARRISQPLSELRDGVERFAREGLSYRLSVSNLEEIGSLAETMNDMAGRLDEQIRAEVRQLNEQEAVFSSMVEGIVVVDEDERVTRLNRSALRFLEVEADAALGKSIQEVVRSPRLQEFVTKALAATDPVEADIVLRGEKKDRYLQAHGTLLHDAEGKRIGAVIVLNDVTGLQRLEGIRRDFVANVSHELKTPITSIKGFIETLRDGAMRHPGDAEKFLEIIAKQADRMDSIIEDLLLLSRVEQDTREAKVVLDNAPVRGVILEAVQVCEPKARAKGIGISVDCPGGIVARINAALLEQAIINLIDNAIKYSEPGRAVAVDAEERSGEVIIRVRDEGCGIEPEHLARVFERFYRVDKARSRKLGGTGLGLSIAKHIVQAHDGTITVESTPGAGSVFAIHLPKGASAPVGT